MNDDEMKLTQKSDNPSEQEEQPSKTLFVFKGKKDTLRGAEAFLRNRGWEIQSSQDLRSGLAEVIQLKPSYTLICVDQSNQGVRAIPKLIKQAIQTRIMLYVDNHTPTLTSVSQEIGCNYIFAPPVSGPAIERMIWRILRDEKRQAEGEADPEKANQMRGAEESESISVRGKSKNNNVRISQDRADGSSVHIRTSGSASGPAYNPTEQTSGVLDNSIVGVMGSSALAQSSVGQNPTKENSSQALTTNGGASSLESEKAGTGGLSVGKAWFEKADDDFSEDAESAKTKSAQTPQSPRDKNDNSAFLPTHALAEKKDSKIIDLRRKRQNIGKAWTKNDHHKDSIFLKGTDASLKQTLTKIPGENETEVIERVEQVSRLGCIEVNAGKIRGYLLFAWGADRPLDEALMNLFRQRLAEFLRSKGESFESEEALAIEVIDVSFESWAVNQGEFLRRAVHEGHELAVGFFPGNAKFEKAVESDRPDMVKIGIDELHGDAPVEFEVYLHLPTNNRYILYTPEGGLFYESQKKRLKSGGIKEIHLKKTASKGLRRYRIQRFLNERILEATANPNAAV